jgi:hypothetical protein
LTTRILVTHTDNVTLGSGAQFLLIRSIIDHAELKESISLSRTPWRIFVRLMEVKDLWLLAGPPVVLTIANLFGKAHETWRKIGLLYAALFAVLLLRQALVLANRRYRIRKVNRKPRHFELAPAGIRIHAEGEPVRIMRWSQILNSRVGERVLVFYYRSPKSLLRRRKYFIVPLRGLSTGERHELLLDIPKEIRGRSIRRALERWRLM